MESYVGYGLLHHYSSRSSSNSPFKDNILLHPDGHIRFFAFESACFEYKDDFQFSPGIDRVAFLAPEIYLIRAPTSFATDVYAVACICVEVSRQELLLQW